MYSWNDFINDFPYTNFSDINVSWFLNKFKQIFDEWEGLYNQMLSWKTATDEYNATWRTEQERAFTTWENNFETAIDAWKTQTESDIDTWETDTIASLEAWKAVFINQYNALRLEVEQIADDAEAAKNAAQASATSAANSASSASATALALQASLGQIDTNTADISELKTQFNNYAQLQQINARIQNGELIPFDLYTLVEYIQSDATDAGQAKINTGLMLGPTLRTELDMALTQIGIENYMGREGVNGKNVRNAIGCSATIAGDGFYFGFGNENLSLGTADTQRHLFFLDVPNLVYGYDNVKADKTSFTYGSEYSNTAIYLFGRYAGGTVTSHTKLYSAKFYSSGALISYFMPVVRKSDNRPGMFDVIRQEFFTNTIVGKLIAGDPVVYIDNTLSISGVPADAKATGDAIQEVDDRIEVLENTDKSYSHDVKYDEFSDCLQSTGNVSSYLFFTDPHIYRADVTEGVQASLFGKLREAYNSTPTDFIMCGGDWLQGGDLDVVPGGPTKAQACAQLGFVDGIMNKLFNVYKPIFGNHDRNFYTLRDGARQTLTRSWHLHL